MSFFKQQQLSKQKLIQAQDKYHSNSMLCEILSMAESLPFRLCLENKINYPYKLFFDKYDYAQIKYNNNSDIIAKKLVAGIQNFLGSFEAYEEDHKKYSYPSNLNQQQICEYLFKWKECVPQDIQKIYDELINFFKSGKSNNFQMHYNNFNNNNNPFIKQENLNDFADKFINAQYMINSGNKNVKDLYEKNGNYEFNAEIGKACDNRLKNKIDHSRKVRREDGKFDLK